MVLRHRDLRMASEQPLTKKQRRDDQLEPTDEPDFIAENEVRTDLSALHLSLPANVNEDEIKLNAMNAQLFGLNNRTEIVSAGAQAPSGFVECQESTRPSIEPAPNILCSEFNNQSVPNLKNVQATNHDRNSNDSYLVTCNSSPEVDVIYYGENGEDEFHGRLIKHCLCGVSESTLRKPFEGQKITDENGTRNATLMEWSTPKTLQFLSNLQLLLDVYLKQNNKGFICSRIVDICENITRNEYNLVEQIISLNDCKNKYVTYVSAKVLSSLLITVKTNINNEWLETIVNFLTADNSDFTKMNFALEVIKRVVDWKDVEMHVLEDTQVIDAAGRSNQEVEVNVNCVSVPYSDAESFDTSPLKGLVIRSLESKWPELIIKMQYLITHNGSIESETCILTFLALWESIISVKANLSIIDINPFYAHLEIFVGLLNSSSLPPIVWKQLLSLFNEVLCYGSTLALQDMLPDDSCRLAHLIVRYVKDFRLLDSLPFRRSDGFTVNSFVGTIPSTHSTQSTTDNTLLQKMVLLVLKSVAVTIKETRSDSSDSSIGSDDYDFYQDMQVIERSIRDVLKKVDVFIKNSLDFHPESSFSKVLLHLFHDQDDYMIEAMVCTLDITVGITYRDAVVTDLLSMLNPVHSFIEFLKIVSHDSDVLLDYLVSNETCFLLYLLRFLKYVRRNFSKFVSSCYESGNTRTNELDNTMTVLIRLKMQINRLVSKELFPYNINPVLRLLDSCENLYEGNEYS